MIFTIFDKIDEFISIGIRVVEQEFFKLFKLNIARLILIDSFMNSLDETRVSLNIEIIEGGPVATARNNAAKLVTTPYILFIDADVIFFDNYTIRDAVFEMEHNNLDLIGANIKCYEDNWKAELGFMIFNKINHILKHFSPFAVGAFMLTRKSKFDEFGGFQDKFLTSEDYFLSRMYDPKKFKIINHYFGQDARRFKKMGYFGMAWYLIKNFWNRNNEKYWKNLDASKYWN